MESSETDEINNKMPWPAYSEIFKFDSKLSNEKNYAFVCKFCFGQKIIHANKTSTANLRKHINAKHPHYIKKIDEIKDQLKNKRQNEDESKNVMKKQLVLEKWESSKITQKKVDTAILRFVIETVQPLSLVDNPAFIDLFKIGLPSSIRIICTKTLREKLIQSYVDMKSALDKKLSKIDILSTTADLWSKAKRSYLGITAHWIDERTLKRESAALACRRMKGKHSFDVLASAINSVFLEYHIQNKVCCTTTDNGSNFVKAFREFEKDEIDINIEFHDLNNLLTIHETKDIEAEDLEFITLPPHHRCVSHTLNLIAVKDADKALDDISYKKKYRVTFAKLSKLWNKQNQSTQVADKIKENCGVYLKTPVITRWNSTFDSVYQLVTLLKEDSDKINQCLDFCNLQRLTNNEIKFLDEYCQVMEPLAKALDILQSDIGMYMGYLLPVLNSLQEKLLNIEHQLMDCRSLTKAIQQGLNKRFSTTFENKELILASCLHPKFKLNWLNGEKKKQAESYLRDLLGICSNDNSPNSSKSDEHDDFFNFRHSRLNNESGEKELNNFLKSKRTDLELLNNFPKLKKQFIKFNTTLPSSASVERMFSMANLVLTPLRGHLNDDIIEYQLLLKINKAYQ